MNALNSNNTIPHAYAVIHLLDEDGNVLESHEKFITQGANVFKLLTLQLEVANSQVSFAAIYVANESATDVFFDDLNLKHERLVWQENSYYPFGLAIKPLDREGAPNHRFTYNGKELEEETGYLDYHARQMDSQLGRFTSVDPHAENYYSHSSYAYVGNNPLVRIDPDGKDWSVVVQEGVGKKGRDLVTITINGKIRDERSTKGMNSKQLAKRKKELDKFKSKLIKQITKSFKARDKDFEFTTVANIEIANSESNISTTDHVFRLVDDTRNVDKTRSEANAGFARTGQNYVYIEGGRSINEMALTGAHELGHTGYLGHIENEVVNTGRSARNGNAKQRILTANSYFGNLMHQAATKNSQGKFTQGTSLEAWQLRRIKLMFELKKLNGGKQKFGK